MLIYVLYSNKYTCTHYFISIKGYYSENILEIDTGLHDENILKGVNLA